MTDGQVSNTDAVIALAREHAGSARIFTFGIGAGASHHLVRGLARAGGGTAEFIFPGERIEPKVLRQVARLLSPALNAVRVEWIDGAVTQAPAQIPPVFAGGRLMVYGFVKGRRPAAVRLTADSPSGRLAFDVAVPSMPADAGRTICTLAARSRIRELEESGEYLASRGSKQKDRTEGRATKEIIDLGVRYGLMSRETSFVAIERRETPVVGDVKLRKVPIALTTGWGGVNAIGTPVGMRLARAAGPVDGAALSLRFETSAEPSSSSALRYTAKPAFFDQEMIAFSRAVGRVQERPLRSRGPDAHDPTHMLIVLQRADGSWELTPELAAAIGRDFGELRAFADRASGTRDVVRRVWATALAVAFLERSAEDVKDEWRLLADKARAWIERAGIAPPPEGAWIDAARRFL
jgi:Ca-activated chloride channel family protein